MYICICVYVYVCIDICMYIYVYVYIHTHSRTHAHTHTSDMTRTALLWSTRFAISSLLNKLLSRLQATDLSRVFSDCSTCIRMHTSAFVCIRPAGSIRQNQATDLSCVLPECGTSRN